MADKTYTFRVKRRWVNVTMIVAVTALIVAPLTALASHQFTDVPDSHTFHADISWLADNGITLGCNPPTNDQYCPSAAVNRGQMAAFMHRLADNQVVDADKVDGLNAADLIRGAGDTSFINDIAANSPVSDDAVTSIEAPTDGGLLINLEFGCRSAAGTTNTVWFIQPTVDGVAATAARTVVDFHHADLSSDPYSAAGSTAFVPVSAGSHDVGYVANLQFGDGSLDCDINETAAFMPFDSAGATPASATSSGTGSGGIQGG
jgi:hypothetical protein